MFVQCIVLIVKYAMYSLQYHCFLMEFNSSTKYKILCAGKINI